jgi:cytoskeleton protein RodZ
MGMQEPSNQFAMPPDRLGATPIGDILRDERVRRGIKLNEIASISRIPQHHLEAMELGQFHSLPAGVYRSSFLRQYARALGLDESAIVRSFQECYPEPPVALPEPAPVKRRLPPGSLLVLPIAAAGLFGMYNLWQVETKAQQDARQRTAQNRAVATAPTGHAERMQQEMPEEPAVSTERVPLQVGLTAIEPVWVRVKCDGFEAYSGTLLKSELKQFDASKTITVLVGNAAGLAYSINGKIQASTGEHGEVDLLELTAEGVRVLSRHSAPAPSQP